MSIPAYLDITRLCEQLCISERTIDAWVRRGILPAPRTKGGKRLWKWSEVEAYLDDGGPGTSASADPEAERIRHATERLAQGSSEDRAGQFRGRDPRVSRQPEVRGAGTRDETELPSITRNG